MYAKHNLLSRSSRFAVFLCPVVLLLSLASRAHADAFQDATQVLARKVASAAHGPVVFTTKNISSMSSAGFSRFAASFKDELQGRGVNIAARAGTRVLLTLSENATGYLAVVQVQRGDSVDTLFGSLGRPSSALQNHSAQSMSLRAELLYAQPEPLLDANLSPSRDLLETLSPHLVATYQQTKGKWDLSSVGSLPRTRSANRDAQGVLLPGADGMTAVFPGEICRGGNSRWSCEPSQRHLVPPPVDADALEARKLSPWFSAAQFEIEGHEAFVVTGQDGRTRIYGSDPEPAVAGSGWGGEVAALHSGCGSGWQILFTGASDWSVPDALEAAEWTGGTNLSIVAESLNLSGPVIRLHQAASDPANNSVNNSSAAIAVVRNLETGNYEVYRITLSCAP